MNKQWLKARIEEYLEYQKTLTASDYARGKQDGYITALRLIEKLKEPQNNSNIDVEKLKDWLINNPYHQDSDYPDKDNMKLANVEETIKKIDEFTKKLVVPQFVADWFEECKDNLEYCIWKYIREWDNQDRNSELFQWFDNEPEAFKILTQMLDGYEVEKEPLYRVKLGEGYFVEYQGRGALITPDGNKEIKIFDSKSDAERTASTIGGTVEEVAEG